MAIVRTIDDLLDSLTSDFTWRVREISDFKASVKSVAQHLRAALLRGGVPLIYAHWEGYVAFVTRQYTDYVKTKRLPYSELRTAFILHAVGRNFDQMYGKRMSLIEKVNFIESADKARTTKFSTIDGEVFRTKSNLNSDVLKDLCAAVNLDAEQFALEYDFIDKRLVGKRNNIAHGRDTPIDFDEFETLAERTIRLMRLYRNLVENQAAMNGFKLVSPTP
jgi:hypothetical protein